MSELRASVSIVCVYNDVAVRQQCLDRSIDLFSSQSRDIEYLPIDNVNGSYASAGAALNHGVSLAKNDFVVFVHQDVFLHSLTALEQAAAQMRTGGFGLLGAVGIRSDGRIIGLVRDRVVLLGDPVTEPAEVDSVDEVLFLAPREQLLREPLTESPDMAWHAYAVEYGLRLRKIGLRTGVADIPLTHNSLSINIERLDVAHQAVAGRYPALLPIRTTCGVITAKTGSAVLLPTHRWRYQWLRESLMLRQVRSMSKVTAVLADIRDDIDSVINRSPGHQLHILNLSEYRFAGGSSEPLELRRHDGSITVAARNLTGVRAALSRRPPDSWLLLTNLSDADLVALSPLWPASAVLGFHTGIGFWLLLGVLPRDLPPQWGSRKATPLGRPAPTPLVSGAQR